MRVGLLIGIAVALPLVMLGCEPPESEFVSSERTQDLIPAARKPVQEAMAENFGTPTELVAWKRFPVNYGGVSGTVGDTSQTTGESPVTHFPAQFDSEVEELGNSPNLFWMDGKYAGNKVTLTGYDPETGQVSFRPALAEPPDEGDRFIVDPGHQFLKGKKLYARHCLHCHGVSGDGNGPTAEYLNPPPRDYRLGVFKFTSTLQTEKPRRDDLERIVRHGIPGTYMPSFMLLPDDEVEAIVEYVRWLSIRGEMEKKLVDELELEYSRKAYQERLEGGETQQDIMTALNDFLESYFPDIVNRAADDLARSWTQAEEEASIIKPQIKRTPNTPESRARGRKLYLSARAKCASCHGETGKGNGPQTYSVQTKPGSTEKYEEPGLFDTWGNPIKPRDLTKGIYRGGRRPLDVYRRIYAGIKGTPMPAFGGTVLDDEEIWDIVNYVMSLPYEDSSSQPEGGPSEVASSVAP